MILTFLVLKLFKRLIINCRTIHVLNPSSNELRSQMALNSMALSHLATALINLPFKGSE